MTPKFYMQSEIHKEDNPGQSISVVSSVNCLTLKISKYVDYNLQPIVKKYTISCSRQKRFSDKIK